MRNELTFLLLGIVLGWLTKIPFLYRWYRKRNEPPITFSPGFLKSIIKKHFPFSTKPTRPSQEAGGEAVGAEPTGPYCTGCNQHINLDTVCPKFKFPGDVTQARLLIPRDQCWITKSVDHKT
jgi:hypothetical protein